MIDTQSFKEQLLEFVEDREEPFDERFLVKTCNQPVSDTRIRDVLCQLADEGKIVWIDHVYLPTRVLMRRWLKTDNPKDASPTEPEISLPNSLLRQIEELLNEKPETGYVDVDDFIRDAIRRDLRAKKLNKH